MKIQARVVLPQFAHYSYWCVKFRVYSRGNQWSPVFVRGGRRGGLASRWERR